jgi:16S rRNA (cytosine967-C5)-methyltransferase
VSVNIMRLKKKCLELLARIEQDGAYTHLVLQQVATSGELAPEEYPVLLRLVRGTLEQKGIVEEKLAPFLPKGLQSLPIEVQLVLRLSAYQILFLERVKKRDVVFEAVDIVKLSRLRGFSGLVNAVLRKIEPLRLSGNDGSVVDATRNFPDWLVERWSRQHGVDVVRQFCEVSGAALPVYCRVNTLRTSRNELREMLAKDGIESEDAACSPHSLRLTHIPASVRVTMLESYCSGLFFIQDASSTIVADIIAAEDPRRVRDLCAAPGGKACSIALSIADYGGLIYASDKAPQRVSLIKALATRLQLTNVIAQVSELGPEENARGEGCDAVLLDVPCSGFGTVGRKVDVRWSITELQLNDLIALQQALLSAAAELVSVGGVLVYSTCSIDRAENEEVVEAFLQSRPDFRCVSLDPALPKYLCTDEGYFRSWPHHHEMAGAFAAKLRRVAVQG